MIMISRAQRKQYPIPSYSVHVEKKLFRQTSQKKIDMLTLELNFQSILYISIL